MKNKKRSAFTIVELVIVIAVIAILSAVLIPTFGSIIESANKAVDTQLVAQINTVLAIEDVLGGGVNDVVEIQKVVKENGLKLQTKSKGQYIWYDIENKRVVLGGLDENGIVLDSEEPTAAVDANGPALISDTNVVTEIPKGQYKAAISPENFVEGYLFLSTDSADNLADAIHALRNPKGDTKEEIIESLTDTLADLAKIKGNVSGGTQVAALMQDFMNQTAIMTEKGTVYVGNGDNTSVTKVLVSSGMNKITDESLNDLSTTFPQLYIVDLPSTVVDITDVDGVITAGKIEDGNVNGIYFVYCNDEIKRIDNNNGDIANLISVEQRGQAITTLQIVKVYLNKDASAPSGKDNIIIKTVEYKTGDEYIDGYYKHVVAYTFTDLGIENNADSVYEFKKYSFYTYSNPNSIEIGTSNYIINEDEQMLIKNGILTVYAYYQELNADFKIGGKCYTSAQVTSMLADPNVSKESIGDSNIIVISTTATLGSATETTLKIPSGVELLLPFKNNTKQTIALADGGKTYVEMDFTTDGSTKLTIAEGVNLVNQGSIYVDAQLYYHSTPVQSNIKKETSGVLEVNGTITSTGSITALGVIRGSGSIAANGGSVSEVMTIYDWHGGRDAATAVGAWSNDLSALAGLDVSGKNTTPFNNWRMQNVRVDVTINNKTNYKVITSINVGDAKPIEFLLAGPSDALFVMKSGSVVRTMSSEAINGKYNTKLIINGTVEDSEKTLIIDDVVAGASASINFAKIAMPLSHFDVEVSKEGNLTISKNIYKVLPGSSIVVETGFDEEGNRMDGVLNIGTKVVFYNSYELSHTKAQDVEQDWWNQWGRKVTRYGLAADGTHTAWQYSQSRENYIVMAGPWEDKSDLPTKKDNVAYDVSSSALQVALPNTYPVTNRPAKLVVNGTVNFSSGAAFAGEIISETGNATISVASGVTVGGYLIPEGFFDTNNTDKWYYTAVKGLHNFACLNGVEQSLSGTYTSTYDELLGRYTWSDK